MDYVSMKMSIYENYANGKLTQENARQLIDVLNNNYGNTLVQEMVDAENEFMMNSVNVAYESAGADALYEASETFGQKVARIWENFKKWIKGIIDAILGRKNDIPDKSQVTVKKGLPKAMDNLLTQLKKLKSAKGAAAIGAAVAGVIGATAAVKKLKGKPTKGDPVENVNADAANNTAKDIAAAAAEAAQASEAAKATTPAAAQDATPPAAPKGTSSEQKTTDQKPEVEPEKPSDRLAESLKAPVAKGSEVLNSVTGAANVANDVSRQIIAFLPVHAESLTPSREAHAEGTKQLYDKFNEDCGLENMLGNVYNLQLLAESILKNYASFDPDREKSGKSVEETVDRYVKDNGGIDKNGAKAYIEEYRDILNKEYPDTPEGYEKLRSALVDRDGRIVTIVKKFETTYNRVNDPSRARNLQNVFHHSGKKENWSAQDVNTMAKFYINCKNFYNRAFGFRAALRKKCSENPALKD